MDSHKESGHSKQQPQARSSRFVYRFRATVICVCPLSCSKSMLCCQCHFRACGTSCTYPLSPFWQFSGSQVAVGAEVAGSVKVCIGEPSFPFAIARTWSESIEGPRQPSPVQLRVEEWNEERKSRRTTSRRRAACQKIDSKSAALRCECRRELSECCQSRLRRNRQDCRSLENTRAFELPRRSTSY